MSSPSASQQKFINWTIINDFEKLSRQLLVIDKLLRPQEWQGFVSDYKEEQRARYKVEKASTTGEWGELGIDESELESPELKRKLERWEVLVFAEHVKRKMLDVYSTFNDTALMMLVCHAHLGNNSSFATKFVQVMTLVKVQQGASELELAQMQVLSQSRDIDLLKEELRKSNKDCLKKFAGAIKVVNDICNREEFIGYLTAWKLFVSQSRKLQIWALGKDIKRLDAAREADKARYESDRSDWQRDQAKLSAKIDQIEVLRQEETRKSQEKIDEMTAAAAKEAKAAMEKAALDLRAIAADNATVREELGRLESRVKEEEERAREALESLAAANARLEIALQAHTKLHELATQYSELEKTLETTQAAMHVETANRKVAETQRADIQQGLRTEQEKVQTAQHEIARLQGVLADEKETTARQRADLEGQIHDWTARYKVVCAENAQAKADKESDLLRIQREAQEETERQVEKHTNEVAGYMQIIEGRNAIQTAELRKLEAIMPCVQVLNPLPAPPTGPTCHLCQNSIVWRPDAEHQRDEWRAYRIPVKPPVLTPKVEMQTQ
eukprot:GEMP01029878.1.p1 GENE.GEMP01029878.1~~GEMP01029878.1.p1  ORF type:complete len:558 (+),score=154.48 GEMP01029878.1:147-1820(+)